MILANLGNLFWQIREFETARAYSRQAVSIARALENPRQLAYGLLCLGHSLLSLEQREAAEESFAEAVEIRRSLNQPSLSLGALAGLAAAYLSLNKLTEARETVEEILSCLPHYSLTGNSDPLRIYLISYQTLQETNDPRANELLTTVHTLLQDQAGKIEEEPMRQVFLDVVPTNRQIIADYDQLTAVA
jgi:tetratricopeptide (TPR) repeat protein